MSDDGRRGLTIIAFVGSVFSPYYAWARRRGGADPLNHCALNVALYGEGGDRWAMTERGRGVVHRSADGLAIGPSAVRWDGAALTIRIDERAAPLPRPMKGLVRVHPACLIDARFTLEASGRHSWRPVAPCARIEVAFERPAWHWSGSGYFDTNQGDAPLDHGFARWDWCRADLRSATAIFYDAVRRDGSAFTLGMRIDAAGRTETVPVPPALSLPRSRWRVARTVRAAPSDGGPGPRVVRRFEDGPFYARSLLAMPVLGEPALAVHESLSLDRFSRRWVQAMLPFRMPRAVW